MTGRLLSIDDVENWREERNSRARACMHGLRRDNGGVVGGAWTAMTAFGITAAWLHDEVDGIVAKMDKDDGLAGMCRLQDEIERWDEERPANMTRLPIDLAMT